MIDRKLTASPDALGNSDSEAPPPPQDSFGTRLRRRFRRIVRPTGIPLLLEYFAAPVPRAEPVPTSTHDRDVTLDPEAEALVLSSRHQRQQTVADFIAEHPSYDKPLYLFKQSSRLRRLCQKLVDPCSGGVRLHGQAPNKYAKWAFQGLVFAAVIASIGVAAAATPAYRRKYYLEHGKVLVAWYNLTEVILASIFIVEFLVKVIADGFLFTPNAYLLSIANDIDFFVSVRPCVLPSEPLLTLLDSARIKQVLLTIIVNISTLLVDDRFTRSLKAFRALRLINIWPSVRETFYSVSASRVTSPRSRLTTVRRLPAGFDSRCEPHPRREHVVLLANRALELTRIYVRSGFDPGRALHHPVRHLGCERLPRSALLLQRYQRVDQGRMRRRVPGQPDRRLDLPRPSRVGQSFRLVLRYFSVEFVDPLRDRLPRRCAQFACHAP